MRGELNCLRRGCLIGNLAQQTTTWPWAGVSSHFGTDRWRLDPVPPMPNRIDWCADFCVERGGQVTDSTKRATRRIYRTPTATLRRFDIATTKSVFRTRGLLARQAETPNYKYTP